MFTSFELGKNNKSWQIQGRLIQEEGNENEPPAKKVNLRATVPKSTKSLLKVFRCDQARQRMLYK